MQGPIDDPIPTSPLGPIERGGWRWPWSRRDDDAALEVEELEVEAPVDERHDVVEYDLNDWTTEQRTEIDEQLSLSAVPHEWERGVLRVPGAHEALADELVDVIDEADDLSFPGRVDAEVEYEFPEWAPEQRDQLVARLRDAGIVFEWDGYCLGIRAADEAEVDAIVTAIDPGFPL